MKKINLVCIPYAGSSASIYLKWKYFLDRQIELFPIELAGRGRKTDMPFYNNVNEAVADIFNGLKMIISDGFPYAIFGHSLGAMLAFELYHKLAENKMDLPQNIFFSGMTPPGLYHAKEKKSNLPAQDFIHKVYALGGLPNIFLENQSIIDIFTPILRSDFKIFEEYVGIEKRDKLKCNVTVFYGDQETLLDNTMIGEWDNYADKDVDYYSFNDGHLFINTFQHKIIEIINNKLAIK